MRDSMGTVTLTLDEYEALKRLVSSERESEGASAVMRKQPKKRKVSKYNRTYAKEYRIHRAKHPRMSHAQITKLAHKATKKVLK